MTVSASYRAFLTDLFSEFGPIEIRNMFGGAGIYAGGLIFALVVDDTLYLKADADFAEAFKAEGKGPFLYEQKDRGTVAMSYWEVPERLLDDPAELAGWASRAHAVALEAKAKKPSRRR